MKKTAKAATKQYTCVHTRAQKFWGWTALVLLFVCGIMVGLGINSDSKSIAHVAQTPAEPEQTACQIIEENLLSIISDDIYWILRTDPQHNIKIYEALIKSGCPENVEKYTDLLNREQNVVAALAPQLAPQYSSPETQTTCEKIEASLLERLPHGGAKLGAEERIERAKIYANLSERGCAENAQKYHDMAKQELAIARALTDDEFDQYETIEVVETYKRLNMQAAAEEIFETAKKLTNPAIDFILEVERIINEK